MILLEAIYKETTHVQISNIHWKTW